MKFMKLGSKPDAFQAEGSSIRYVSTELAFDIVIHVGDVKFNLHKFPLLAKSNYLQKLVSKAKDEKTNEINLHGFPGGPNAFEICAKFCYGMTVTLNAYNVVAARCGAEYLKMTEDIESGNLIFKIEIFLNSSVFHSWKDSIIVLQTTKSLLPWSEDLKVVGRCIDSIASKTSVDPANVNWAYTYNWKLAVAEHGNGLPFQPKISVVPKDWWVEGICDLEIDLFRRVMVAIKSKGRMTGNLIGEALEAYAVRWLPESVKGLISDGLTLKYKSIIETIISLLPSHMDAGCSCSFLLKLLKVATLVEVGDIAREELVKRISSQLDKASVQDLLIPARWPETTVYDIALVQSLVNGFAKKHLQELDYAEENERSKDDLVQCRGIWMDVGKLIDGYLAQIASDPNVPVSSFIEFSQSIPAVARPVQDRLYRAIDIYLKEHPSLTKSERKKICGLMDVKKLTVNASMHAAQNERLPLCVVVQVLYFEQIRGANGNMNMPPSFSRESSRSTTQTEDWGRSLPEDLRSIDRQMRSMKVNDDERQKREKKNKNPNKISGGAALLLPSRSRRFLDRFWIGGNKGRGENRGSETSGSSRSPTSVHHPLEAKSFRSSSTRHRRNSLS
ncbi:hypothetical protein MKX01_002383 [Papaver californicum]|nr:hypothetical protein MKX01_002383 [Papaver californicum]